MSICPLVCLLVSASAWLAPAEASVPAPGDSKTYQRDAIDATNLERRLHDRVRLRQADCVQRFAVKQAGRMAAREVMFHQELGPILRQCGLQEVGENVAYGYPTGTSVVVVGWMNSPPHRKNIMRPGYRLIGLGARQGQDGSWYVSQVFGRKMSR
ncbi:CAP domain-containing protein [Nocardioides sp. CN2-186]|uniref:CAP domain-containing protein n=1 Tax=Nocardioides tweenelious TaxID=3156607 RepID=UPI0032B36F47